MSAMSAVFYREGKIRITNVTFIFWDLFYPLGYMLVFGVGVNSALGANLPAAGADYNAFFLAGVLGMASFGIAPTPRGRSFSTATTASSTRCSPTRSAARNTCWAKSCSTF